MLRTLRIRLARWLLPKGLGVVCVDDIAAARKTIAEAVKYVEQSGHLNNPGHETTRRARRRLFAYLRVMAAWLDIAFEIIPPKEKN